MPYSMPFDCDVQQKSVFASSLRLILDSSKEWTVGASLFKSLRKYPLAITTTGVRGGEGPPIYNL